MRIGNDLMIFTKKDRVLTAVFLSRTFHELEQIDEVLKSSLWSRHCWNYFLWISSYSCFVQIVVPMPTFDDFTNKPRAKTSTELATVSFPFFLYYRILTEWRQDFMNTGMFFFQHKIEMDLILKYSPFKTESEFFNEFDKITESGKQTYPLVAHGTLQSYTPVDTIMRR